MSTLSATISEEYTQRYEALLRATNAIGTCSDCDAAADVLVQSLREVVPFDYLQLIAFENGSKTVEWHLLNLNGTRQDLSAADVAVEDTPIEWVHESQQALVVADWNDDTRFAKHREFLNAAGIVSSCDLPLARGDRRLGVLSIGSSRSHAYPEDEVRFLSLVANQIALAIDAAVNFYLSRQAQDRLKLILDLTNQVVSNLNFQELLRTISSSVRRVMHCDAAAIMLPEPDGVHLRVHALDFPDSRGIFTKHVLVPIADSIPGETYKSGKPWVLNRLDPADVPPEMYAKAAGEGINSFCDMPLLSRDRSLGVLALASREENAFDREATAFLSQVAQQVAIGVENALAYGEIADLKDKLAQEKLYLEDEIRGEMDFEGIVGQSSALRHVLNLVETVAPSDSTVLLLGETGTGKELIARAIHERSRRKERTFVKLNCAAIPTGLLESELFGHERGAFTGAIAQKIGRLELADQGSLFLDEVGDIPVEIQPKLLRALQEREFERLGSNRTKKVDVRLVAATNRDLEKMMENREFRSDLYYRLNVFPIRIPPLRERPEDIPLLVRYFTQKYGRLMDKQIESIPAAAMKKLSTWHWPGNIRELENFIERSVILTHGVALQAPIGELSNNGKTTPVAGTREANERDEMIRILKTTNGRVSGPAGAAARMGLKRTTLIARMKKLGVDPRRAL
ncbi:MAG TPA: sigma 54-interacting transcriptional regulator [Candidatus Sulfotelmatobacter sp.]|jgi:formate hydrogenlyase transcriptional activator|nr:sigma 54-interacting transcriptional regulator [Candidatus Sulfotelmatobacter sp.]